MSKLGLPLEYQKLPEYFDAHNTNDDTEAKNSVIEKLLKPHNVKTILDMTCGTGSQVFFLDKLGYKCTGSDFSPALLEIARSRALKDKVDIPFIDGDMRSIKIGEFEAVITIFNAVGHLTKAGFKKALRNINNNLNNGGIYIFDIINLEAMTEEVVAGFAYQVHKKVGDSQVLTGQCSTIDKEKGLLTSYDMLMIQKNANKPERFNHKFTLQIYTANELCDMLKKAGFEVLDQYGMDGEEFVPGKTKSILTVAKKK